MLLYKYPHCFWMCHSTKIVSQIYQQGKRGGMGRFIFVFQGDINNKYSPAHPQHNICSVALR